MNKLVLFLVASWASVTAMAVDPFSLPWMNATSANTTYSSSNFPTGIFVVEAYFETCPYCNDNAASVNDLASHYANEPRVQVLDVGIDRDDSSYQQWISDHNSNHPVLKDAQRTLIGELGTSGYPSTYVLDCKMNVVYSHTGEWDSGDETDIETQVDALLKQTCSNN
jgi:peroxiredoxin